MLGGHAKKVTRINSCVIFNLPNSGHFPRAYVVQEHFNNRNSALLSNIFSFFFFILKDLTYKNSTERCQVFRKVIENYENNKYCTSDLRLIFV